MTISETKEILNKIKTFRPFFQTGNGTVTETEFLKEWHKVFEEYNYSDVEKRLNNFFDNPDNYGKIPEAHYLVNTLTKNTVKKDELNGAVVRCPRCNKEISFSEFDIHFTRCSSVNFVYQKAKQYFNQTLSKEKLFALSKEEFDDKYLQFIDKLKDKVNDPKERNRLNDLVKVLKGRKVDFENIKEENVWKEIS